MPQLCPPVNRDSTPTDISQNRSAQTQGLGKNLAECRDRFEGAGLLETRPLHAHDEMIYAKQRVPFVQANLLDSKDDDPDDVEAWRAELQRNGVWANKPVPLFPYPGSPEYRRMWGLPDDGAWERALDYYLDRYSSFSDIQEARPRRLAELEIAAE